MKNKYRKKVKWWGTDFGEMDSSLKIGEEFG